MFSFVSFYTLCGSVTSRSMGRELHWAVLRRQYSNIHIPAFRNLFYTTSDGILGSTCGRPSGMHGAAGAFCGSVKRRGKTDSTQVPCVFRLYLTLVPSCSVHLLKGLSSETVPFAMLAPSSVCLVWVFWLLPTRCFGRMLW